MATKPQDLKIVPLDFKFSEPLIPILGVGDKKVDLEEFKAVKTRGRPRTRPLNAPIYPKRPRGRPRIKPITAPICPKRPRGRPRKPIDLNAPPNLKQEHSHCQKLGKVKAIKIEPILSNRPRGRPKKLIYPNHPRPILVEPILSTGPNTKTFREDANLSEIFQKLSVESLPERKPKIPKTFILNQSSIFQTVIPGVGKLNDFLGRKAHAELVSLPSELLLPLFKAPLDNPGVLESLSFKTSLKVLETNSTLKKIQDQHEQPAIRIKSEQTKAVVPFRKIRRSNGPSNKCTSNGPKLETLNYINNGQHLESNWLLRQAQTTSLGYHHESPIDLIYYMHSMQQFIENALYSIPPWSESPSRSGPLEFSSRIQTISRPLLPKPQKMLGDESNVLALLPVNPKGGSRPRTKPIVVPIYPKRPRGRPKKQVVLDTPLNIKPEVIPLPVLTSSTSYNTRANTYQTAEVVKRPRGRGRPKKQVVIDTPLNIKPEVIPLPIWTSSTSYNTASSTDQAGEVDEDLLLDELLDLMEELNVNVPQQQKSIQAITNDLLRGVESDTDILKQVWALNMQWSETQGPSKSS